jgi:hypothetical protein
MSSAPCVVKKGPQPRWHALVGPHVGPNEWARWAGQTQQRMTFFFLFFFISINAFFILKTLLFLH